ncbi:hypothetical protein Gasu2_10440 [Galdieria sulphuraria]|nr:hypothetical protein Gasu2_10440 [Galdieria sulphuraria]
MDRYCHSQDSFESNFPPLEFLLEEQQKHEFRSEQYPNHHNVATRLAEDFILETPPSKKMIQKHFLEISSPVTLSKIQFRSTELSKYNEDTYLTPNPRCAVFSTNKSFQKKSTEEHRNVVEPEKIRDSQSLLCNESKFENIIDVDDACSAETTQDNDFSYKNAPVVEGNFGHLNERQQSKFNSSCEHESSKVFDVLQFVGLPRESNEDTIKRENKKVNETTTSRAIWLRKQRPRLFLS